LPHPSERAHRHGVASVKVGGQPDEQQESPSSRPGYAAAPGGLGTFVPGAV
jgi:hypothetical protein